jgi:hypothetical protein
MRANGEAIAAIIGLAVLAGCALQPKPTMSKPSDTAVKCLAYLGLERQAGRGALAELDHASANWRTIALVTMTASQIDAYYASSVAVYGVQPVDRIKAEADRCLKRAPKNLPAKAQKKL